MLFTGPPTGESDERPSEGERDREREREREERNIFGRLNATVTIDSPSIGRVSGVFDPKGNGKENKLCV